MHVSRLIMIFHQPEKFGLFGIVRLLSWPWTYLSGTICGRNPQVLVSLLHSHTHTHMIHYIYVHSIYVHTSVGIYIIIYLYASGLACSHFQKVASVKPHHCQKGSTWRHGSRGSFQLLPFLKPPDPSRKWTGIPLW